MSGMYCTGQVHFFSSAFVRMSESMILSNQRVRGIGMQMRYYLSNSQKRWDRNGQACRDRQLLSTRQSAHINAYPPDTLLLGKNINVATPSRPLRGGSRAALWRALSRKSSGHGHRWCGAVALRWDKVRAYAHRGLGKPVTWVSRRRPCWWWRRRGCSYGKSPHRRTRGCCLRARRRWGRRRRRRL